MIAAVIAFWLLTAALPIEPWPLRLLAPLVLVWWGLLMIARRVDAWATRAASVRPLDQYMEGLQ